MDFKAQIKALISHEYLTQSDIRFQLLLKVREIIIERHHDSVTNHMSNVTRTGTTLHTASLFHCSASLLSANVVHSGSSVNYSTSQEGRGTWWWGVGSRIPDHKTWQPPSCIVHHHHSNPVSLFSPCALCILSFQWQ